MCKDYKLCDRLSDEIVECKAKLRELQNELKLLEKKSNKAKKRIERSKNGKTTNKPEVAQYRSSTPVSPTVNVSRVSSHSSSSSISLIDTEGGNRSDVQHCSTSVFSGDAQQTGSHFW